MAPVTHQTIRLGRGKHSAPEHGACVMELASMLADEPFSDHPECVCPVIGSLLRAYNDSLDHQRRQDLYAYAAKVVGSRATKQAERERAKRITRWTTERLSRRGTRLLLAARFRRVPLDAEPHAVGGSAVRAIARHTDCSHAQVLALIDELLEIGGQSDDYDRPKRASSAVEASAMIEPSSAPATTSPG